MRAGLWRVPGPAPVALAVLLVVVSRHTVTNLGGTLAMLGYAGAAALATCVAPARVTERIGRAPSWVLPALVATGVAVLAVVFVLGVPPTLHAAMGVGSDRADALNVALARLAAGDYPYSGTTYLGNPITPLPGALLLAAPFWWATGSAAWQNVAWLLLLLPVLNGGLRLRTRPTLLWALAVFAAPEVLRQFVIGDDLVASAVPALAAVAGTLVAARGRSTPVLVAAALLLGVATCTRPHMVLVLVVVVATVGLTAGTRRALIVGGCAGLAWVALIVPFLLGGLARFSPVHVAAKVTGERAITVGIVAVALVAVALAVAALRVVRPSSPRSVGWFCAAILFAPSVLSLARALAVGPGADLDLTLGAAAVPFAVWALSARELSPHRGCRSIGRASASANKGSRVRHADSML